MTRGSAARSFTAGTELFAVENRNSGVRRFGPSTIPGGAVLSPAQIRGARRVPGPGRTERSPERRVPSGRGRRERAEMNGAAFRSSAFPFPSERGSRRGRGEKYFSESQPRGIPFPGAARLGLPTPGLPTRSEEGTSAHRFSVRATRGCSFPSSGRGGCIRAPVPPPSLYRGLRYPQGLAPLPAAAGGHCGGAARPPVPPAAPGAPAEAALGVPPSVRGHQRVPVALYFGEAWRRRALSLSPY